MVVLYIHEVGGKRVNRSQTLVCMLLNFHPPCFPVPRPKQFPIIVLFLLAIVLSVLLRYTDSDYPSGIFKLFYNQWVASSSPGQ